MFLLWLKKEYSIIRMTFILAILTFLSIASTSDGIPSNRPLVISHMMALYGITCFSTTDSNHSTLFLLMLLLLFTFPPFLLELALLSYYKYYLSRSHNPQVVAALPELFHTVLKMRGALLCTNQGIPWLLHLYLKFFGDESYIGLGSLFW